MLLVFGDSHSLVWQNEPNACVRHLGAALAYNLLDDKGCLGKWGLRVFAEIEDELREGTKISLIMLSFGEIDIRTRIKTDEDIDLVSGRLFAFAEKLFANFKTKVIIYAPIATTWILETNSDWPIQGTEEERNDLTVKFSNKLKEKQNENVGVVSICESLMCGRKTRREFYCDDHHLNLDGFKIAQSALWSR